MNTYQQYSVLDEGVVLLDYGPITMTLDARSGGKPFTDAAIVGAESALNVFNEFSLHLDLLRTPAAALAAGIPIDAPEAVVKMMKSVLMLEEGDFTSLAAVAGTTADFAVDAMVHAGADYALANNGGDIAWHIGLQDKKFLKVGLISDIADGKITHSLKIQPESGIGGLATSGLGGRSLTRGIASAVTTLASNASMADAAATAIANACYCNDPAIEQCYAEELDYGTDIPRLLVTKSVGTLKKESIEEALSAGALRAERLIDKGMICGAVIFVAGKNRVVGKQGTINFFEISKLMS